METTIYLVRHGETNWNRERRFQGQMDIPLNHLGELQAKKLAERLHLIQLQLDAIYSSDLIRAKNTAEIIADYYNMTVNINLDLRERYFGFFEGRNLDEIKDKFPDYNILRAEQNNPYNIEPFDTFCKRIYDAIFKIALDNVNNNILIVSHGAAINAFLNVISNGSIGTGITKISNTSVTTLKFSHLKSSWDIVDVNDDSHIEAI